MFGDPLFGHPLFEHALVAIMRPERYVFGRTTDALSLDAIREELKGMLHLKEGEFT